MLYVLNTASPKLRKAIIKNSNPEVIKAISEISHNTLKGNNKICAKTKQKLSGYKRQLRVLACPKQTINAKRKTIIQRGGFLPLLIGSVLSGLIGSYLNR